jgi:DNA/RNA endonuclease G (NUC1)
MKRILILALLILQTGLSFAQRSKVSVDCGIYKVEYSEVYEQPLKLSYTITCKDGKVPRKGLDFYTNDSIKTSDNRDYEKNVWDKGHLAPAAHFNCQLSTLKTTFSYLNCVLQHETLNRGAWRLLEAYERELSKKSDVVVEILVDFSTFEKLPTGACVPKGFWKKIYLDKKLYQTYYFANVETKTTDYTKFLEKK